MHLVLDIVCLVRFHNNHFNYISNLNHNSDTAAMYGNETELGIAMKELLPKHNLSRKDVFITTKLCKYNIPIFNIASYFLLFIMFLQSLRVVANNRIHLSKDLLTNGIEY